MSTIRDWARVLTTDSTATSFASKVATRTEPSGDGVISLVKGNDKHGKEGYDTIELMPFGGGADDETFDLRVIGWRKVNAAAAQNALWVPTTLCEASVVLCSATGVDGTAVENEDFFADAITVGKGIGVVPSVTANVMGAVLIVSVEGYEKCEVTFDRTGSSDTANALYVTY